MDRARFDELRGCFDLPQEFTAEQLKQAYRDLVQVWHPDRHGTNPRLREKAEAKLKEINEAYSALLKQLPLGFPAAVASSQRAPSPPPPSRFRPASTSEDSSSRRSTTSATPPTGGSRVNAGCLVAGFLGVAILVIALVAANSSTAPNAYTSTRTSSSAPALPPPPPPPNAKLDEKSGYKELRFGMSPDEVAAIEKPFSRSEEKDSLETLFWYCSGPFLRIGDYEVSSVRLYFFDSKLARINVILTDTVANSVLAAFSEAYGPPTPRFNWTRGSEPLRATGWLGAKVTCVFVAPQGAAWDSVIIYDDQLNAAMSAYAEAAPQRAAQCIKSKGIGRFVVGMALADFSQLTRVAPKQKENGIREAFLGEVDKVELPSLGGIKPTYVRATFFQDVLFDLRFCFRADDSENISKVYQMRFPSAANNDRWTMGTTKLRAREATEEGCEISLVSDSLGEKWDTLVFADPKGQLRAAEFKEGAPKRAANDL